MTDHIALIERLEGEPDDCPFCGRDPYHYVDNGVGMERVAVTCCDEGIAYFQYSDPVLTEQVALRREAAAALRDLTELLAGFVQDEDDARSNPMGGLSLGGLMDCRDNAGCVYQSAGLAARIAKARVLTLPSAPNQAKEAGE